MKIVAHDIILRLLKSKRKCKGSWEAVRAKKYMPYGIIQQMQMQVLYVAVGFILSQTYYIFNKECYKFYLFKSTFNAYFVPIMKQIIHIHHHHSLPQGRLC